MKYKLIAADLDGTLLDNDSELSRENELAQARLAEMGTAIALATGRTLSELPKSVRKSETIRYAIYSNGAAIIDRKTNECIADFCIRGKKREMLFEILADFPAHITVRSGGKSYVEDGKQTPQVYEFFKVDPNHARVTGKYSVRESLARLIPTLDGIEDVSAYFHTEENRCRCAQRLSECGISFALVGIHGLEIFDTAAGKGTALSALTRYLGISAAETIGIGDSGNDVSLIRTAGLGLAMANADDSIKKTANAVACSNDAHIMKYVLEKYF